jgi:hypothetical protein
MVSEAVNAKEREMEKELGVLKLKLMQGEEDFKLLMSSKEDELVSRQRKESELRDEIHNLQRQLLEMKVCHS